MMRDFVNTHNFLMSINYHTYGNVLIFPWGYKNELCPDSTLFRAQCEYMTRENGFGYGNPYQTVGYAGNGVADDWLYDDPSHQKIYTITPEAGAPSDGFWPAINRIVPICKNTFIQNIKFAELALDLIEFKNQSSKYLTNTCNYISFSVKRLGLQQGNSNTVSFTALTPNVISIGPQKTYNNLQLLQQVSDSIEICISPASQAEQVIVVAHISYANHTQHDTLKFFYGIPNVIFSNNGSSLNGFVSSLNNTWGVTNQTFVSSPSSITDSPNGNYADNRNIFLTTISAVTLNGDPTSLLTFYAKWDIEAGYDYVEVQASTNNGATWTNLCGKYTHAGSQDQNPGQPLYDGTQLNWVKEEISLAHLTGNVKFRFHLKSDGFVNADGFYFDDLSITQLGTATSLVDNEQELAMVNIFPNPANEKLTIETNLIGGRIELYNMLGQMIGSKTISNSQTILNMETIAQGVYLFKIFAVNNEVMVAQKVSIVK